MLTRDDLTYQWALPESLEIPPDHLQVRLDFFRETVIMYLLEDNAIHTRVVSALDIAGALSREIPVSSGLLPEVALWCPPRVWRVALQMEVFKPPVRFALPMPGLVFTCQPGRPPRVYAARRRPASGEDVLYQAPLFNVFADGRTCAGTHKYPDSITEVPESFFASLFTVAGDTHGRSRKHPRDLLALWQELDGKRRYLLRDLEPHAKVKEVLQS